MARSSKKVKLKPPLNGWLARTQGWPLIISTVVGIVAVLLAYSDNFEYISLLYKSAGTDKRNGGSKLKQSTRSTSAKLTSKSSSPQDQQSPSVTALAALLDASLLTPLARRTPVPLAAVDVLLAANRPPSITSDADGSDGSTSQSNRGSDEQSLGINAVLAIDASPRSNGAGPASTGGGFTPLGYALLLHDTALVHHLLTKHHASPTVAIAAPPPDPSKPANAATAAAGTSKASSSSPSRGIVLGASHESALGDGLKPLHLALLQKDLVTDASRRYFAMNALKDHENSASHSSSSSSSSLSSTTISSKVSTTSSEQVDPSSPVAAVLRRLMVTSSPSEDTLGSPLSHRVISAAAVQAAVHQEVTAPMLESLFQAMWQNHTHVVDKQQSGVDTSEEHKAMKPGARVVMAALQSRDKWGRTPLHLALQTGNQQAASLLLHHWQTALDILAGETSTATGAAPEKDAATRASNVKANAAAAADLPETPPPVSSLSSDFPPGFGCWPLGAVDQLNRNVFHYAASRGDEKLLNFLRAFDPSTDERTTSNNNNEVCSSSSSSSSRGSGDDDDDDDDDESTSSARSQGNNQEVKSDHPCGAFLEARDVNGWAPMDYLLQTRRKVSLAENDNISTKSAPAVDRKKIEHNAGSQEVSEEEMLTEKANGEDSISEEWHVNGGWPQDTLPSSTGSEKNNKCDIDAIDGATLSARDFLIRYLAVSRPVLIQGAAKNWPFRQPGNPQRWTKSSFMKRFGDHPVQPSSIPYAPAFGVSAKNTSSLASYVDGLFDANPHEKSNEIATAAAADSEEVLYVFSDRPHVGMLHDFALSPPWLKVASHLVDPMPAAVQFYVGPKGSGAPVHWHGDAWNALAFGKKAWALWPPARAAFSNTHDIQTHTDYSVEPHDSTGSGGDSVRDSTEHNNGSSSATTTSSSSRKRAKSSNVGGVGEALHCEQKAGDVMFVPSNWGHAILNLQASVGVAVEFRYAASFFA